MRIVIVEDVPLVQEMLLSALSDIPGAEIAGVADSCEAARELVARHQPSILTLDLKLKDGSSIPVIPDLLAARPGLKIIVFSLTVDDTIRQKVLRAGALHCVDKCEGVELVVDVVKQVLSLPPYRGG